MINNKEPYLIEYNIRMGDPECRVLMMKLKSDLEIIFNATNNNLNELKIEWKKNNCITVVFVQTDIQGSYVKDKEIKNLNSIISDENNQIFHAGTYRERKIKKFFHVVVES